MLPAGTVKDTGSVMDALVTAGQYVLDHNSRAVVITRELQPGHIEYAWADRRAFVGNGGLAEGWVVLVTLTPGLYP